MGFTVTIQFSGDTSLPGLTRAIDKLVQDLTVETQSQISRRTPILTGRARRGWQTRQNSIENKVPYIERLEKGYSRQAPNGFVKQGIRAAIDIVEGKLK